jgi:hypothetical protein
VNPQRPTLTYDDLPPGSDIRREQVGELLRITIPASEPPPQVLRPLLGRSLIFGAAVSFFVLLGFGFLVSMMIRSNQVRGISSVLAWSAFGVVCVAMMLLAASVQYFADRHAVEIARQQITLIAATPTRLLVETSGPFGKASYELASQDIDHVRRRSGYWYDERRRRWWLPHLRIHLRDGNFLDFVPGRDRGELAYIAAAIESVTKRAVRPA